MFWPRSGSVRLPSSSAGSPNIAGSGAGWPASSGPNGPWWLTTPMNCAMPAPKPLRWYVSWTAGEAASAPSRSGRIDASGGSCATSVRTSSGCARDEGERVHRAAAAGEQVDRARAELGDDPMQVVGVLLGRGRAGRIGLRAALDAARVVGHDGAIGEVAGERAEPAGAHRRADQEQHRGRRSPPRGRRRSGRRRARPGCGSSARSSWSSGRSCRACATRTGRRLRRGSRRSGRRPG